MCRGRIPILQLLLVTAYSTFAQDIPSNKPANLTLAHNETKQDSTITWIKISPITPNSSTTEATLKNSNINCTLTENISSENQNIDFAGSLRRKRRKRRRNKYKAWNQRRPEHSHKKHSTKVEINKPVQFLIPPDYQENLIPKETSYYKSRNDVVKKLPGRTEKKIPPPVRHLLPPLVDTRFINSVTPVPVQQEAKKSKHIDWSPNSTNRGSTKFKHTVYYSDSGNEIISNYEITSTTPKLQIKFTTSDDSRALTPFRVATEIPRNYNKLEYRPIVVQPTPIQYHTSPVPIHNHTTAFPSRETRINSLLSFEVANAGMQVINMTNFQLQNLPSFQNQFVQNSNFKQFESPAESRSPNAVQQSTAHPINHQQSQLQDRTSQQINYEQSQSQQLTNFRHSQPQDQISYQQSQPQQLSNYQQSQSPDRISPQINYQKTPSPEQISQQINHQQVSSQHQQKTVQNQQTRLSQPQINNLQPQSHQQPSRQSNYQQYQQTQLPPPGSASSSQNFQQIEHLQPYQSYNQQSFQNYQPQTTSTYSRVTEHRTTTPISNLAINRTNPPQIDKTDNFKGLDLAESKYFSDIPSEQEFNAVQNDGQVIPGVAGKDYPIFDQFLLQKRRFHCRGLEGYFADVTSRCQVFYICNGDGAGEPMLCPNGTLFSQELLVCDWWYNVDC